MLNCLVCDVELRGRQRKFCSDKCKRRTLNWKHQNYDAQRTRGIERKLAFVKTKGGCCQNCGYKKNLSGLCFHHTDEKEKSFEVNIRACSNNSMEVLLLEIKKCIVLCHNCHMELHYPELDMET